MAITLNGTTGITTADIAATTLTVDAGFGSNATAYGVRAWVNFNGTGTVAIRESGNVSSITDNGVGDYTVNFTSAMPDANYSVVTSGQFDQTNTSSSAAIIAVIARYAAGLSTGSTRITYSAGNSASNADGTTLCVSVVR